MGAVIGFFVGIWNAVVAVAPAVMHVLVCGTQKTSEVVGGVSNSITF